MDDTDIETKIAWFYGSNTGSFIEDSAVGIGDDIEALHEIESRNKIRIQFPCDDVTVTVRPGEMEIEVIGSVEFRDLCDCIWKTFAQHRKFLEETGRLPEVHEDGPDCGVSAETA